MAWSRHGAAGSGSDDDAHARLNKRRHDDDRTDSSTHKRPRHSPDPQERRRRRSSRDGRDDRSDRRRRRSPSSEELSRDRRHRRRRHSDSSDDSRSHQRRRRSSRDRHEHDDRQAVRRRYSRSPVRHGRGGPLPPQAASFAIERGSPPPVEKQKPNYEPTGLLAREANTVNVSSATNNNHDNNKKASGNRARQVVLKYHEPPEARRPPPSQAWRLYHFSGANKEPVDTIALGEHSCWLFGREAGVADVPLEHETCGKQHAVVQFRHSVARDEYGDKVERVRPYLIDLESKAGTKLDGRKIEAGRYVELRDGDVVRFGGEDGEWVVMLPPAE